MKIYLIFFILIAPLQLYSQQWDNSYIQYGKIDGMPSNTIYTVCSDKHGFLWIGSDAGLIKFDGNHYTVFTTEDGLPSNDVFEIFCDSKNRLWLTTMSKQIAYYENGEIRNIQNDTLLNKINISGFVMSVFEDQFKSVWIISKQFKVYKISDKSIEKFDLQTDQLSVGVNKILTPEGIYIISVGETYYYSYSEKKIRLIKKHKDNYKIQGFQDIRNEYYILSDKNNIRKFTLKDLDSGKVSSVNFHWNLKSWKNNLWHLTNSGVSKYNPKNLTLTKKYLQYCSTSNLEHDIYNNIWISTLNNGIYKIATNPILNFYPDNNRAVNAIHSIALTKTNIIIGTNKGKIFIINRSTRKVKSVLTVNKGSSINGRILKIVPKDDMLLFSSDFGFFCFKQYQQLETDYFEGISNNTGKNLYLLNDTTIALTHSDVLLKKGINKPFRINKIENRFYSFALYNNQKIFGSQTTLYYLKDSLEEYPLDQPFHYKIMDLNVYDSLLIAATTEKGIFFIHHHKVVRNVNFNDGLGTNNCAKVMPYKNDIYIATNNGIAIYNYQSKTMKKIMESDGLASNNVLDMSIEEDTIYAGTDNGLSIIPIKDLNLKSSFDFFIYPIIEQKDTIWDRIKKIKTRSNHTMQLTLNAITLGVKGNVKYYYRIKELDTNFSLTLDPTVKLNITKPGKYILEAYATDVNFLKSVVTTLHINVVPYWYQTLLFKIISGLLLLLTFILIYKAIVHYTQLREQKRSEEENRIHKLELEAWKSNINPHFLFNSFNTMQSLFSTSRFERANDFVSNFSVVLRKTIDNSSRLLNSFEEEVSYLQNYLSLERYKKNNRMSYTIKVSDEKLKPYFLPSLLLQPIIENSIKHGIKSIRKGEVDVEFILNENNVTCIIQDNGIGLPEDGKDYTNSKGLKLVQEKIRIVKSVTNQPITFTLENKYDAQGQCKGAIAIFTLPIIETNIYDEEKA